MKHKKDIKIRIELHEKELAKLEIENPKYSNLEYDKANPIEAFEFWEYSTKANLIEQKIKILRWILI